jgi:hypothetical protein
MRTTLIFALSALTLSACGRSDAWSVTRSETGRFVASFPGTPVEKTQADPSPSPILGTIETHLWMVEQPDHKASYGVIYSDHPAGYITDRNRRTLAKGASLAGMQAFNAQTVRTEDVVLHGFPGCSVEGTLLVNGEPGKISYRNYLVGSRLYQIMTLSADSLLTGAEDRERFLSSFDVLDPPMVSAEAQESPWVTMTSEEGNFEVAFPGSPRTVSRTADVPGMGQIQIHNFLAQVEGGCVTYNASYSDYPEGTVTDENRESLVDQIAAAGIQAINGQAEGIQRSEFHGFPAREVRANVSMKGLDGTAENYIYLINNRVYQLLIIAAKDTPARVEDKQRFLSSFKLLAVPLVAAANSQELPPTPHTQLPPLNGR